METNFRRYPNLFVSYKPFTTFNNISDTLTIPQRPMFGSVLTTRMSYQLKRRTKSWKFSIMHTESKTVLDTLKTGNKTSQLVCAYTDKKFTNSLTVGLMNSEGPLPQQGANGRTKFIQVSSNYNVNKNIHVSAAQELAIADFGLSRTSSSLGGGYNFEKIPISARLTMRQGQYRSLQTEGWKDIYSGSIEVIYRFCAKIK